MKGGGACVALATPPHKSDMERKLESTDRGCLKGPYVWSTFTALTM